MNNEKFENQLLNLKRLEKIIKFFDDSIELELADIDILKIYRKMALKSYNLYKNSIITEYKSISNDLRYKQLVEDHEVGYL